jgi:N12 class adenine-specific DNA methylase
MELKRPGLAPKTMFVVPKHLVAQWAAEFLKLYPHAKLQKRLPWTLQSVPNQYCKRNN